MKENTEIVLPGKWATNDGKLKNLHDMNIEYLKNCLRKLQNALERYLDEEPDMTLYQMATQYPHVRRPELYELNYDQVQAKITELKEIINIKQN